MHKITPLVLFVFVSATAAAPPSSAYGSTTIISSDGDFKVPTDVYADDTDQYNYIIDVKGEGRFFITGARVVNDSTVGIAAILLKSSTDTHSIILEPGYFFSSSIRSSGAIDGLLISDTQPTAGTIRIGEILLNDSVSVDQGAAVHIKDMLSGGTVIVGSKGLLTGNNTLIKTTENGYLPSLVIRGELKTTGAYAIDLSEGMGAGNVIVESGLVEGNIKGPSSADDLLNLNGGTVDGTVEGFENIQINTASAVVLTNDVIGSNGMDVRGGVSFSKPDSGGQQQVSGNISLIGNSYMEVLVGVDDLVNPALKVAGDITLDNDAEIYVVMSKDDYDNNRVLDNVKVFQADNVELTATADSVDAFIGTPFLHKIYNQFYQDGVVTVSISPKSITEVVKDLNTGQSSEEVLTSILDNLATDSSGGSSDLYARLLPIRTAEDMAEFASENRVNNADITQEVNITLMNTAITQVLRRLSAPRQAAAEKGVAYGDGLSADGFWLQAIGADIKQNSRKNTTGGKIFGYDASLDGFTLGIESSKEDYTYGGAVTLVNAYVEKDGVSDTSRIKNYQFSAYSRWEHESRFVDSVFNYGQSSHKRHRYIDVQGFSGLPLVADFNSQHYGVRVLGGYDLSYRSINLQPMIGFNYEMVRTDRYKEKDPGNLDLAQSVEDQKYQRIEVGTGITVSKTFAVAKGEIEPYVSTMVWHDLKGQRIETTAQFTDGGADSFVSRGADPVRTSYQASLGVVYHRDDRFTFFAGYELGKKLDYTYNSYSAAMKYNF